MLYDEKSIYQISRELAEAELERYRKNPEEKMPVMLPARELSAIIIWPDKFR